MLPSASQRSFLVEQQRPWETDNNNNNNTNNNNNNNNKTNKTNNNNNHGDLPLLITTTFYQWWRQPLTSLPLWCHYHPFLVLSLFLNSLFHIRSS